MPKRVLIVYRVDKSDLSNSGIVNKLRGQIQGLRVSGCHVDYMIHDAAAIYLNQDRVYEFRSSEWPIVRKIKFYKYLPVLDGYDIITIRYGLSTPHFIKWLSNTKKSNPKAKVIIDMPTYPYDEEWKGLKGSLVRWMDDRYNKELSKYVDLIIHSGEERSIWGIPTYHMTNGVLLDDHKIAPTRTSGALNMIAIGKWQYWHGLDRLLQGLSRYNGEYHLDIVGEGPRSATIKAQIKELGMEDRVTWHGTVVGSALRALVDRANLGIGTLGLHRKGVTIDSSLKHRFYCAAGLPFVLSSPDSDFGSHLPYVSYVPLDESPVDIKELSSFVQRIDYTMIYDQMRTYAMMHLSWTSKMKELIEHIEEA